jgi:hypothetical protein
MPKASIASSTVSGAALIDGAHRFEHVGAENGVDQKARCAPDRQRQAIDLPDESDAALQHFGVAAAGGDHFDQRHLRHRVEEVNPDQALGRASAVRKSSMRRLEVLVASTASGLITASSLASSARLASRSLEDRLDHHVGLAGAVAVGIGNQPVHDVAQFARVPDALAPGRIGALQAGAMRSIP